MERARDKVTQLNDEVKAVKTELSDKDAYIDQLQKRLTRLVAVTSLFKIKLTFILILTRRDYFS